MAAKDERLGFPRVDPLRLRPARRRRSRRRQPRPARFFARRARPARRGPALRARPARRQWRLAALFAQQDADKAAREMAAQAPQAALSAPCSPGDEGRAHGSPPSARRGPRHARAAAAAQPPWPNRSFSGPTPRRASTAPSRPRRNGRAAGRLLVQPFRHFHRQGRPDQRRRRRLRARGDPPFRARALFGDMLLAVESHPAMLFYLDNQQSVGPDSPPA